MKTGEVIVFKFFFKYTTYICHHRDEKKNDLISTDELANLDHDNKDDEEDKVSVEVGVAVPLLLLVETHLDMFTDYDIVREKIDNTIDLADCYL